MPHPLPLLAAVAATPMLGLAMHAMPSHAGASADVHVHAAAAPAVANLPNNLCASCHGGGRVVSGVLDAGDLVAAHTLLQGAPQG